MTTWLRGRAWLFGVVGAVAVAGCGGKESPPPGEVGAMTKSGDTPRFLFITNGNSDWWNAVEKGMKDGGDAFNCKVEMRRNNNQTQGQVEKLREALSRSDVAGVAVSAIEADAPGVIDAMRELQKSGKLVITIDSDVVADAADARSGYIGTDNIKAGETAGKAAAAIRPDGGKVVGFVGAASAANARGRVEGFKKGAGPKFTVAETMEDGSDQGRASSNVKTAITKNPDLGLLLGIWSYDATAIGGEVRNNPEVRKKTSVVTFDLDEGAVADIADGFIDASVCQNPYEMGYQGVKLLRALRSKDEAIIKEILPDGKTRDTGVRIIVPKEDSPVMKAMAGKGEAVITVEEMKSWLASKGLKSS